MIIKNQINGNINNQKVLKDNLLVTRQKSKCQNGIIKKTKHIEFS